MRCADIARAGGGEYFELGSEADCDVATIIIERKRWNAKVAQVVAVMILLYFLVCGGRFPVIWHASHLREATELCGEASASGSGSVFVLVAIAC